LLVGGSWYAREIHRCGIDQIQHCGCSLRKAAEWIRSFTGRQERWLKWRPLDREPADELQCHLSASTLCRWMEGAGEAAKASVPGQLEGAVCSGQVGTDGLWAKLLGGAGRVVLMLTDTVSGLVWPPVIAKGESSERGWGEMFQRALEAGLDVDGLRGMVSDGATGLVAYLSHKLEWVNHQICVFHKWRGLRGELAKAEAEAGIGLAGEAAKKAGEQVRKELASLVHGVMDAGSEAEALAALAKLSAHSLGAGLAGKLGAALDGVLVHLLRYNQGIVRVAPEWNWRSYRQRLSRGRNHRTDECLETASLVWAIYHNFERRQWRSEKKRTYKRRGQSPLEMAGLAAGRASYLDALGV
jgi:hypothetical protein